MPITLPTAHDAIKEAQRIADLMVDDFRKFENPDDPRAVAAREQFVLASIAIFYYDRSSRIKHDHTIGAALIDSEEAMPYMDFPESVLQRLKNELFGGQGGEIWRKGHNEWAFGWDEEKDDE